MIVAGYVFRLLANRSVRALVSVVAGTGVLGVWFFLAPAAQASDEDLTSAALEARKAVGLPAIGEDPAVLAAAGAVLDGSDSKAAFTAAGGTGDLITTKAPAGGALSNGKLKLIVFDPRVTSIVVLGRDRKVAVAAALDPSRPFPEPILAGAVVDPGVAGSLAVLFPPHSGTIPQLSLEGHRGRQLVTLGIAATAVPGAEGAILVEIKGRDRIVGPQIGYGLTYKLKVGTSRSYAVRTRPIPSVLRSRSFVAGIGFKGADRQLFMQAVNALPSMARKVVDTFRGAVTASILANSAPICGEQTSCAGLDAGHGYFMIINRGQLHNSFGLFAITHELGHLADFLGLDTFSHEDFKKLFSASPKWKHCFPVDNQCVPLVEVFADQFGYFGTNAHDGVSGYGDGRLASHAAFARVLGVQWAFRPPQDINPLAGFGPLAESFANALHSEEGEL